jgi:hypothetical protein
MLSAALTAACLLAPSGAADAQAKARELKLAELVLLNAIENFYNGMNLALGIEATDGLEAIARAAAA